MVLPRGLLAFVLFTSCTAFRFRSLFAISFIPFVNGFNLLSPKTPQNYKIGAYMAIGVGFVVFAGIVFYLGLRRGRTGTWKCWQEEDDSPSVDITTRPVRWKTNKSTRTAEDTDDWEKDEDGHLPGALVLRPRPTVRHLGLAPGTGIGRGNGTGGYGYPAAGGANIAHVPTHIVPAASLHAVSMQLPVEAGIHTPRRQRSPGSSVRELDGAPPTPVYELGSGIRSMEQVNTKSRSPHRKRWSSLYNFNISSHFSHASSSHESSVPPQSRSRPSGPSSVVAMSNRSIQDLEMDNADPPIPTIRYPETTLRSSARPSVDMADPMTNSVATVPESCVTADEESASQASGMNWEGLEWLRRMYRQRGSYRVSWRLNTSSQDLRNQSPRGDRTLR